MSLCKQDLFKKSIIYMMIAMNKRMALLMLSSDIQNSSWNVIKRHVHGHWWNWHYDVTFDHTSWLFHVINYVSVTKRGCGCA